MIYITCVQACEAVLPFATILLVVKSSKVLLSMVVILLIFLKAYISNTIGCKRDQYQLAADKEPLLHFKIGME